MTAGAQPLDQGIIQTVKLNYRRNLMAKLLSSADKCNCASEFSSSITVLDAVRWVRSSWIAVDQTTIQKCFKRCGFQDLAIDPTVAPVNEITLSINTNTFFMEYGKHIDEIAWLENDPDLNYITFDDDLPVHFDDGDDPDTILQNLLAPDTNAENDTSESDDEEPSTILTIEPPPTYQQVENHLLQLIRYAGANDTSILDALMSLQSSFEHNYALSRLARSNQSKITQFLK